MKIIKVFFVFLISTLIMHAIGCQYFPVSEDNILLAPDWYALVLLIASGFCTAVVLKKQEKNTIRSIIKKTLIVFAIVICVLCAFGGLIRIEWVGLFLFVLAFIALLAKIKSKVTQDSSDEDQSTTQTLSARLSPKTTQDTPSREAFTFLRNTQDAAPVNPSTGTKFSSHAGWPKRYVCISVKTSGLDEDIDEIVELAAIRYENGYEVSRFQSLVRPETPLTPYLCRINDMTNEMLENAPSLRQALLPFLRFLELDALVAHNIDFDVKFIRKACFREGLAAPANDKVDTLQWSKEVLPDLYGYKKTDVMDHLQLKRSWSGRAISDCEDTHKLHRGLLAVSKRKRWH